MEITAQAPIGVALLIIMLAGSGILLMRPVFTSTPLNKPTRIASATLGAALLSMLVVVISVMAS